MFGPDGKYFDVAIDHGFFGDQAFLSGMEDMAEAVQAVAEAGLDAVQLSPGQAHLLQEMPGKAQPRLLLRTDIANVYGRTLPRHLFSKVIEQAVELTLDAACLCLNLVVVPGGREVHAQCLDNIMTLKPEAERYGMLGMIEPLVMRDNAEAGGYTVDGDLSKTVPLVRQAVELGADAIEVGPCNDIREHHRVIEIAGRVPVLARGSGRASEAEILERTHTLMQQGAKGIVYGRNVIQHENPAAMTRALMPIVHERATPERAMKVLDGST